MALITAVPDAAKLSLLTVAEHPIYIALSMDDPLAWKKELHLQDLSARDWILPAQHANPHLYELIQRATFEKGAVASDAHYVMTAEEASELVLNHKGVAFLTRTGAWRIARGEITMRPLVEEQLRLVTKLATRADERSRLVGEFVRAAGRKLSSARPSNSSLRNVLPQCVHRWKCKSLGRERLESFAMDDFSFLRNPSLVQEEKIPLVPNSHMRLPVMKEFSAKSVSNTACDL